MTGPVTAPVLRSDRPVTLVGGGPVDAGLFDLALAWAPVPAAADGGAAALLDLGHRPRAVIGDMDSLPPVVAEALGPNPLHRVTEQESTDFEKCLTRIDAPWLLGVGFLGGRLDHELAVLNALARHPARRCLLLGPRDVCCLAPAEIALDLAAGTRVSLFPLGPVGGRSAGLAWPLNGIDFAPGGAIGTSNLAEGPVRLGFDAPAMLLILPQGCLGALVAALDAAPGWTG